MSFGLIPFFWPALRDRCELQPRTLPQASWQASRRTLVDGLEPGPAVQASRAGALLRAERLPERGEVCGPGVHKNGLDQALSGFFVLAEACRTAIFASHQPGVDSLRQITVVLQSGNLAGGVTNLVAREPGTAVID
jgi:hypothetical protein